MTVKDLLKFIDRNKIIEIKKGKTNQLFKGYSNQLLDREDVQYNKKLLSLTIKDNKIIDGVLVIYCNRY